MIVLVPNSKDFSLRFVSTVDYADVNSNGIGTLLVNDVIVLLAKGQISLLRNPPSWMVCGICGFENYLLNLYKDWKIAYQLVKIRLEN